MAIMPAKPSAMVVIMPVMLLLDVCASGLHLNRQKHWSNTIRKLNRDGPYVGLITVYPPEEDAFFSTAAFNPHPAYPFVDLSGRRFRIGTIHGKSVIYVRCGIGMRNAAAATQQMVDLFDISGIIHFGIAGNANSSLSVGDVIVPKQFAHTGIWDWLKPKEALRKSVVTHMDVGNYNVPKGQGINQLGRIGFSTEEFFSKSGEPSEPENVLWTNTSLNWLKIASELQGMELEKCLNSSLCLPNEPKLVMGLRGSTANIFVDNPAYREFLFQTFGVSLVDMESSAVVMTSLSNGFSVIVLRGLSDLAGGQEGQNSINVFGPLAALNTAKAVVQFIKILPPDV